MTDNRAMIRTNVAVTILAIVADPFTRAMFPKVVTGERLLVSADLNEGLAIASSDPPDLAFVEIGIHDGAGLAMVHHLKALVPNVTIVALASRDALEAAANAVALGGAGLLILPASGDEILGAIATVKASIAARVMRADMEQAAVVFARAASFMTRVAELADAPTRNAAAAQLVDVLTEATGASGAAVYLSAPDKPTELVRASASPSLEDAPAFGMEADILEQARLRRLLAVPLATRTLRVGHVLLERLLEAASGPLSMSVLTAKPAGASREGSGSGTFRIDGLVRLIVTQAATAFCLLGERERGTSGAMKDPTSSAYSFSYYVDVAGREIDKARRYKRRFAIATIAFEATVGKGGRAEPLPSPADAADTLLGVARDTDVLARVDDHEFHLLMPETGGIAAHAYRRRALLSFVDRAGRIPRGLSIGVSTFPHDGQDLAQLLRLARRRAEETRSSIVRGVAVLGELDPAQRSGRSSSEMIGLTDLFDAFTKHEPQGPDAIGAAAAIELPIREAAELAAAITRDALRGGAALIVVAHHDGAKLGAAVRAAVGPASDGVTLHAVDIRALPGTSNVEALAILAEHGAYALLGRVERGVLRGLHAADPLLADLLAERLGRAAGLRIFS